MSIFTFFFLCFFHVRLRSKKLVLCLAPIFLEIVFTNPIHISSVLLCCVHFFYDLVIIKCNYIDYDYRVHNVIRFVK